MGLLVPSVHQHDGGDSWSRLACPPLPGGDLHRAMSPEGVRKTRLNASVISFTRMDVLICAALSCRTAGWLLSLGGVMWRRLAEVLLLLFQHQTSSDDQWCQGLCLSRKPSEGQSFTFIETLAACMRFCITYSALFCVCVRRMCSKLFRSVSLRSTCRLACGT